MSETGIVRRIDALGRIVIPMEMRRTLGISVRDPLSIALEGEHIVVSKHRDSCAMCGSLVGVVRVGDRAICPSCIGEIKRIPG